MTFGCYKLKKAQVIPGVEVCIATAQAAAAFVTANGWYKNDRHF